MIRAAAFVPATPLLVPAVAQGAAPELDDLRAACGAALAVLVAAGCEEAVVVGSAPVTGACAPVAVGDLRTLGLDVHAALRPGRPGPRQLSRALVLGVWLLDEYAPDLPRRALAAGIGDPADVLGAAGAETATGPARTGLLVVGDGSAALREASPLSVREGAVAADREAATAVASADLRTIVSWAPRWSDRAGIEGRAPWQAAAGACASGGWRGTCTYDASPYGVTYLVATWEPA